MESINKQLPGTIALGGKGAKDDEKGRDNDDGVHPLFMESLPPDFATNPVLAALGSLLENDKDDDKDDQPQQFHLPERPKAGGGKVRHEKRRSSRRTAPYHGTKQQAASEASVGEAQLFLGMWKL